MPSMNNSLSFQDRTSLLGVARRSIESGLRHGCALEVEPAHHSEPLQQLRTTFVTLGIEGRLRGCVGTLEASLPLVTSAANHAFSAAFTDPRFPRLSDEELHRLNIRLSVLSLPEPLVFVSEDEVLDQLRPGIDGLILRLGEIRATFLPAVWDSLPDPYIFLSQLKYKAGLPLDFWAEAMVIERYTAESFSDDDIGEG